MLWYIIDGWNLIHKIPSIKNRTSAKRDLIVFIKKHSLTGSKNNKVTIIFDGRIDIDIVRCEKDFEIIFSGLMSADEIIGSKVKNYKNKRQIIVVSDDYELINYVKNQGASILKINKFLSKKKKVTPLKDSKEISYTLQKEINDELRRIWLKEE